MANRITVHAFDSFEGLPAMVDSRDADHVTGVSWLEGEFRGKDEALEAYCAKRYRNCRIHKGFFEQSITQDFLESLRSELPILVWIDCDYYSSAKTVMERLSPYLPSGCVLYFDDHDELNYGSRLTGEARIVHEINQGLFGEDVELVPDTGLALNSRSVYRFIRLSSEVRYRPLERDHVVNRVRRVRYRTNDSPLP